MSLSSKEPNFYKVGAIAPKGQERVKLNNKKILTIPSQSIQVSVFSP